MNPEVAQLLAIIEQAYNKPSWHGTNLRGSVRRVTAAQAAWRASAGRHNIWEIVVHAAYWKYAVGTPVHRRRARVVSAEGIELVSTSVALRLRAGPPPRRGRPISICSTTCTRRCGTP